jgi:hypothetical protein
VKRQLIGLTAKHSTPSSHTMGSAVSARRKEAARAAAEELSKDSLVLQLKSKFESHCDANNKKAVAAAKLAVVYKDLTEGDELRDPEAALKELGVPADGMIEWKVR